MKFLGDKDSHLCMLHKALSAQKDLRKILNGNRKATLLSFILLSRCGLPADLPLCFSFLSGISIKYWTAASS